MDEQHLCPTCKFYRAKPRMENLAGYCHRYPRQYSGGYYNVIQVSDKDWCGEWVASDEYLKNLGGVR